MKQFSSFGPVISTELPPSTPERRDPEVYRAFLEGELAKNRDLLREVADLEAMTLAPDDPLRLRVELLRTQARRAARVAQMELAKYEQHWVRAQRD